MSLRNQYDQVWRAKLGDQEWLAQDGAGRVDRAVTILSTLIDQTETPRILDIGCGRGTLGRMLKAPAVMWGIDIAEAAVNEAREIYKAAAAGNLDEDDIPFAEPFDFCVMLDVIEHVLDPRMALTKASDVLRPGGRLLLSTPNIIWWHRLKMMVLHRRFPRTGDDEYGYDGGHLHCFTLKDVLALMHEAGFSHAQDVGERAGKWLADFRGGTIWVLATK